MRRINLHTAHTFSFWKRSKLTMASSIIASGSNFLCLSIKTIHGSIDPNEVDRTVLVNSTFSLNSQRNDKIFNECRKFCRYFCYSVAILSDPNTTINHLTNIDTVDRFMRLVVECVSFFFVIITNFRWSWWIVVSSLARKLERMLRDFFPKFVGRPDRLSQTGRPRLGTSHSWALEF